MKNSFLGSMKVKLVVWFLAISLAPLIILGVISYVSSKKALETGFINSFNAISEGKEESVLRYLRTKVKVTNSFATDIFIRNTVEKLDQRGPDAAALAADLNKYLSEDKTQVDPDIEMTSITNTKGRIIASTDKSLLGQDKSQDPYFTEGKSKTFVKEPYVSPSGKDCIAVSVPLKSPGSGAFIGVIVNRYETGELNKILGDRQGMGDTGETYMINKDGYMMTDSRFNKDTFLKQKIDSEPVKIFQAQKKESGGSYKNYRGSSVLGVSNGEKINKEFDKEWLLLAEIDADEAFSAVAKLRNIVILFAIIISVIIGIIAINLSATIVRPVTDLASAAVKVAGGDLAGSIAITSEDEIGSLADSFGIMLKNLNSIMAKTTAAVGQITSASGEILAASQQQAASAREQSSAVSETTSAAAELSKSAEQIGESIKQVSQAANNSLGGMAKIKEAIGRTGEKITSLSEKSQQIGKITDLINDVADQTNLLAVNAAIEAARAGEHGRGFTVVADEIRRLADSTAKSTKDITALVEIIQHEMSNAIMAMEQSVINVNDEVKLSQESAERAKEIALGAAQQISGSQQIADAMKNTNEAMKQIAAGAGQAQAAAKQLTVIAGELKEITGKFKL